MREIKFRAFHAGLIWEVLMMNFYSAGINLELQREEDGPGGKKHWPKAEPTIYFNEPSSAKLMQYTGLKDKNGVEIYEGDIVKTSWQHDGVTCYDYELVGEIIWNETDACFSLDMRDHTIRFITTYEREELIELEVIGNIYQNPELLEGV